MGVVERHEPRVPGRAAGTLAAYAD
jgi:hypothetical protein